MNYAQKRHARPKAVYVHVMDSTDGCAENMPQRRATFSPKNPFGVPGRDYSDSFAWTFTKYVPEEPKP